MAASIAVVNLIESLPASNVALAELVERGLPTDAIAQLRELGLSFAEVAEIIISPRTLKHRKARGEDLSSTETERVVRVSRIVALAEKVFGSHEKAMLYLRDPDDRLKDRTPLSMLQTESGGRVVESLLWQIDEGMFG
jgi:putative toxin-antitoxin system antitoxin component (TIGR02293 family)